MDSLGQLLPDYVRRWRDNYRRLDGQDVPLLAPYGVRRLLRSGLVIFMLMLSATVVFTFFGDSTRTSSQDAVPFDNSESVSSPDNDAAFKARPPPAAQAKPTTLLSDSDPDLYNDGVSVSPSAPVVSTEPDTPADPAQPEISRPPTQAEASDGPVQVDKPGETGAKGGMQDHDQEDKGASGQAKGTTQPVHADTPEATSDLETPGVSTGHRRFVLILPATKSDPELCKTIATAVTLGYPAPIIINWGADPSKVSKHGGGRNLIKIPGLVDYLEAALSPEADASERIYDDDLVLMVDGYDVWFQLPAQTLLSRYHKINEEANARLREQWTGEEPMPMKQTVVAASSKNCYPKVRLNPGVDLQCESLPESPLRPDLYGPDTDNIGEIGGLEVTQHLARPRWINGGLYMGPAADMRRLFRRARAKLEEGVGKGVHFFSEQGLPGEVFGEQEIYRTWRRDEAKTKGSSRTALSLMNREFEYNLGLDYGQLLASQLMWMNRTDDIWDGEFVQLNDQSYIDEQSHARDIAPVRLHGIPDDLQGLKNPMQDIMESPPTWGQMPLFADLFLSSVPAMVHHNHLDKTLRQRWWHKPWYHQHLRQLLPHHLKANSPLTPLANVQTADGMVTYWATSAEERGRGPRIMNGTLQMPLQQANLQDVCHGSEEQEAEGHQWWNEVFRDSDGPFEYI